ncbi:MAG: hypothetical protein ABJF89_07720 [Parasphingorhabdus sp.]|uniref:hypothetical protein n=1 Tax=Parasphingorhabdus sp. TaxID=2709688 RepID=UPI003262EBF0
MKIDVTPIITDYLGTLRDSNTNKILFADLFFVFGFPVIASIIAAWIKTAITPSFYLSLFTLFGVFAAVLIALQSNLLQISDIPRKQSKDPAVDKRLKGLHESRQTLAKEVCYAISYLELFFVFSIIYLIIPIALNSDLFLFKWTSIFLLFHALMNILIILRRFHALFRNQFE